MRSGWDSMDIPLVHLVALDLDFEILEPPRFRERAAELAARLGRAGNP
jgi:hypothetical protein